MMTQAQHDHYICLWGAARKALRASGVPPKDADARRKAIHAKIGAVYAPGHAEAGLPKSSWDLNNGEFDKVKAEFLALSKPTDLNAQIRQVNQPAKRLAHSAEAQGYLDAIGVEKDATARELYVDGVCRNITGKGLMDLEDRRWRDVLGALKRTAKYKNPAKEWPGHDVGEGFTGPAVQTASSRRPFVPVVLSEPEPEDEHDAAEPVASPGLAHPADVGEDVPF